MSNQEIDTDRNLVLLGRLLRESVGAKVLMGRSLSPFKLDLTQVLFLKNFEEGEKTVHDLSEGSQQPEESLRREVLDLASQGYLDLTGEPDSAYSLSPLGRRVLDSKWDEVERLQCYMSERISPLTLEAVIGLLRELNNGYFQGLD